MPNLEIKPAQHVCPYCRDMYWIDNIDPAVPKPLTELYSATCLKCATTQVVETPGDMHWCCGCGEQLHGKGETIFNLQMGWWIQYLKGVQP